MAWLILASVWFYYIHTAQAATTFLILIMAAVGVSALSFWLAPVLGVMIFLVCIVSVRASFQLL